MNKYIQIFIDFIPNDTSFVNMLMPRYEKEFILLGYYIEQHSASLCCKDDESLEELYDFLDGNGFEVIYPQVKNPYNAFPIQLIPIYEIPTEPIYGSEIEKEIDRLNEAFKKFQSAISEYVPIQEIVLPYASMEVDERPLLECEELFAPRPIRLRICRCMELLRLVSTCGRGSSPLPRPP